MLQPVGPLPPSVYWRRRAVATAAAVLVLALLVWAIAAAATSDGGSDVPAAAPPAPAPWAGPPSPVASRGALPSPANAAALFGTRVLPGTPSQTGTGPQTGSGPQTGTGPLPGSGSIPGADSQPAGHQSRGAQQAGAPDVSPATTSSGAAPSATPAPPAPSNAPAPPSAPAPQAAAAPPRCADGDLRITARTDKPRYAVGERPLFGLVVTNTGSIPCSRDLDAARQAMAVVVKPGDGLWGSNDCSPGHTTDVRTLAPGQEAVFSVRWAGRRSEPGCSGDRSVVPPGAYQLLTRLDGTISDPAKFTLGS